ncbi:MAG TPA: hypothetical protein VK661_00495 [Planctomycetota bacterium]|nr:hypothetical protein [Planctomycetota bacterium]
MVRILAAMILLSGLAASISTSGREVPPPARSQVLVAVILVSSSGDLWADVREVDPALKALEGDVARRVKDLGADAVEDRIKAIAELKAMGLCAYGAIRKARDLEKSDGVRAEVDAILKNMIGDLPKSFQTVPATRRLGAKEGEALRSRWQERKLLRQEPNVLVSDGSPFTVFLGEEVPLGVRQRRIRIEGDGERARMEEEISMAKKGLQMLITPKVLDADKEIVSLDIAVTTQAVVGTSPMSVKVNLNPSLKSKEFVLAGPFPAAGEKEEPWWILLTCKVIS